MPTTITRTAPRIVLPTATWYEKNDLNTSDMHPFIHPLTAAALLRGVIVFLPTDFHGDLNSSRGSGLPT